jgi:hypothetical protein
VTGEELELRRRIMVAFAETAAPPALTGAEEPVLRALADRHVVVLDDAGAVRMAHPFAAHRDGVSVTSRGRTWWGNCAWDAYGIAAALRLDDPMIEGAGPGVVFHVAVPAARWWDDIGHT